MSEETPQFQLSTDIEHWLALLSKLYAQDGERKKQEIIVNSQVRIVEQYSYDNWDGGTFGHALYLIVPESLYLQFVKQKHDLQKEIKTDINKLHNVQNEFIDEVFLEMEKVKDGDWRRESGILQSGQRNVTPSKAENIWGQDGYRVFLSHKSEVKKEAAELKEKLNVFGISAFVAHEDIHPTKEWQDEIENALASMDAFVALLTEKFHDSDWTDQEVGYALGRGVPMIAVKRGRDPYGFIGKFQALSCSWEDAPLEIVTLLVKQQSRMLDAYIHAAETCKSFGHGNELSQVLPHIETLSERQADKLASAFNENCQLQGSYGFSGAWSSKFGIGLSAHLTRVTGLEYLMTPSGEIKSKKQ